MDAKALAIIVIIFIIIIIVFIIMISVFVFSLSQAESNHLKIYCSAYFVIQGLAWAANSLDAEYLASCRRISIYQDVRKNYLLVRFRGCTSDLTVRTGLLGYRNLGTTSGAQALNSVVEQEIRELCMDFDGSTQEHLVKSICSKVALFVADGAADEQLAGRLASQSLFKNCKLVRRDKTHAAMSVLERPWSACAELKSVVDKFALGHSIVQKIHYSPQLQEVFGSFCDRGKPHNLSIAKQRFASVSKPLQRAMMHLDALLSTVVWVLIHRNPGKEEHILATKFLEEVSEREILLASMLADLADEGIRMVRYFDATDFDISWHAWELRMFMSRIHLLVNEARRIFIRL